MNYMPQTSDPDRVKDKPSKMINTLMAAWLIASIPALWYSAPRAVEWVAGVIVKFI